MISLIVLLIVIAVVVAGSGTVLSRNSGNGGWLALLGLLMLLPGLCGSFFLGVSLLDPSSSAEAQAYMTMFISIAIPSIQLSCFLLWLMARKSDVPWFRKMTRIAGWFGAASAAYLLIRFAQLAMNENGALTDKAMIFGVGLLIAGLPFLIGGLQALRLPQERPPEGGA